MHRAGVTLAVAAVLLAACSGSDEPRDPAGTTPVPTRSAGAPPVVDICKALPVEVVSYVLGVEVEHSAAAVPAGDLLGECDYTRSQDGGYHHIYVGARAVAGYGTFAKRYGTVPVKVAGQKAFYGPSAGLLIKVPLAPYFLQIAVQGADGDMLLTPAELLAQYYLGAP